MSLLPSAENVHTLGSSRSSGMIVAEYCQRLLTVLQPLAHSAFCICPCRQTLMSLRCRHRDRPSVYRQERPSMCREPQRSRCSKGMTVRGFFRFFSFPFSLSSLFMNLSLSGKNRCLRLPKSRNAPYLSNAEKTLNDYTLSRSSISMQYIRLPSG